VRSSLRPVIRGLPDSDPIFESAKFVLSVGELDQVNAAPLDLLPEIAFIGRSNAGKSSVINVLANQRRLAFASKLPGRTQLLNFFRLSRRGPEGTLGPCAYLVDLPGNGFARVDDATRLRWNRLVGGYLQTRRMLTAVVLVIDARRGLLAADAELLAWIQARPGSAGLRLHLLLNKSDQLKREERLRALNAAEHRANQLPMPVSAQLFSAREREGIDELRAVLAHALEPGSRV
jgi:GTP-binding protein